MSSNIITKDKNLKKNISNNINLAHNLKVLKAPLYIPKLLIPTIEFLTFLTNRTQEDLFTQFIIDELMDFIDNFKERLISSLSESRIFKRLRILIHQYYDREVQENNLNNNKQKTILTKENTIEITIFLPKKLVNLVDKICNISTNSRMWLLNDLIFTRLDYIYSESEILYSYINDESGIYNNLKEGIKDYY